jgi:dihydroorotate dehydrogenase/NAD-dependent dihydropyrimidine dehydrogenase PreA subunit
MGKPDLSIEIAGIKHDPAIWIGAGPLTGKLWSMKKCVEAGAGAVDTKRTALPGLEMTLQGPNIKPIRKPGRLKSPYRWFLTQGMMFYSLQHCEPNFLHFETAQALIRGMKAWRPDIPVYQNACASIYMPGDNPEDWITIGKAGQKAGADAVVMDLWTSGHYPPGFSVEKWASDIFKPVVEALDIPVFYKMLPTFDYQHFVELCKAVEKAGVAALQPTEGPVLIPPCDIQNGGKPVFSASHKHSFRTLVCGPWLRAISNTMVYLATENVSIPVMGIGGIMDARDAIERIMYGASAVGLCTAPLIKGFKVITDIRNGIQDFMKQHGFDSIEDFRGIAKKHVVSDMYLEMDLLPCAPEVDPKLCNGCGICTLPGHCNAMMIENGIAVCNEDACEGCGLCAQLCPQGAIRMKELK